MPDFGSYITLNESTYTEVRRYSRKRGDRITFIILSILGFAIAVGGLLAQDTIITGIGLVAGICNMIFLLMVIIRPKLTLKRELEQIQENFSAAEMEIITSFADDRIKTHFPQSGATIFTNYNDISRFIETPNMFVLLTKTKQAVITDKLRLIQEQKNEAFIQFIKNKCENVEW